MTVDIIILSHAKTQPLLELTQKTIDSLHNSEANIKFNVLVIEQEKGVVYANCATGFTDSAFNYNAFLNKGIELTKPAGNKYVALCNNDLVFGKDWATNIISAMKANGLLSACPAQKQKHPVIEYGYANSHHMNGWCIMCDRKLFDIIGEIDDSFPFWFADNIYAEQLKSHNVKHAVVNNSVVKHLGSSTLKTIEKSLYNKYTTDLIAKFIEKHPNNESAKYFKASLRPHQ